MIVTMRRSTLVLVFSLVIISVLSSTCMAMPDKVKITKANGQVVQYSINDAISNNAILACMNSDIAAAFESGQAMVGILSNGKILNLQQALQSADGYQNFENRVKLGSQTEAPDLVATIDWEGNPIVLPPIGDTFEVLSIE